MLWMKGNGNFAKWALNKLNLISNSDFAFKKRNTSLQTKEIDFFQLHFILTI